MITLKYEWATIRRDELTLELSEAQKEIDFLLAKLIDKCN